MERRFLCTACGLCCTGQIPLALDDALAHADKFPLAVVWTPVRQGGRSFQTTAELGITIELKKHRTAAVSVAPTADIPSGMPCPELTGDGLCAIHDSKPLRCRAMPFSANRDETDQQDLLIPRPGWKCDTSEAAPVVYRDRTLVDRRDFDAERRQLVRDAAVLKPYARWLLDSVPSLGRELHKIAMQPAGGRLFVSFATLIPRLPKVDIYVFAEKQLPVMEAFAVKTIAEPGLAKFHRRYADAAKEWRSVLSQRR